MRSARPDLRALPLLLACLWAGAAAAAGSTPAWQWTPRVEHSQVEVNGRDGRWDAWSLTLAHTTAPGEGLSASVGRQDRNGFSDDEVQVSAWQRLGAWDATATLQSSPDALFLPEWGYQLQVERAAGERRRAGGGYRRLQFRDSSVQLVSAHMNFYRGDDELGVEYRLGRNAVLDHDIRVLQVRASRLRGPNQVALYLTRGDYLFDALGIPGGEGEGWSASLAFARALTPSTTLRWELGAGGESDTFRQRSIAVSVQYRP